MDQTFVLVRLAGKPWCSNNVSSIHANGVKMIVDSTASRRADSIYMQFPSEDYCPLSTLIDVTKECQMVWYIQCLPCQVSRSGYGARKEQVRSLDTLANSAIESDHVTHQGGCREQLDWKQLKDKREENVRNTINAARMATTIVYTIVYLMTCDRM